jgi:hypothetical protein
METYTAQVDTKLWPVSQLGECNVWKIVAYFPTRRLAEEYAAELPIIRSAGVRECYKRIE